jgi:class 3 adenylate cyclase
MSYTQSELDLEEERKKNELLLHNILPVPIADRLKVSHDSIAEGFQSATILFADIVGFTTLAESKTPEEVIGILNEIFSEFDQLVEETNLEKIKTIGDAYMVASGLPLESPDHAKLIAWLALKMKESLSKFNQNSGQKLEIRIGIHSGPVVAGVIGKKKFTYDVWGDTVNTASRMESHGIPGKIQISEKTFSILKDDFECMERGLIEIKGKGFMKTYILMGYKG